MDVITFGAATRDVFLRSAGLQTSPSTTSPTGSVGCVVMGGKIPVEELFLSSGGGATNAAVTFARWGLATETIVRIGDDEPGQDILQELQAHRIHTGRARRVRGGQTGYSTLLLADDGERTALVFRGVSGAWERSDVPKALGARIAYITSLSGAFEVWHAITSQARREGVRVFANPGHGELSAPQAFSTLLPSLDGLFLNVQEARLLTALPHADAPTLARTLGAVTPLVVITDGPRGAYALSHTEGVWYAKTRGIPSRSRTGAGDAFASGVTAALHHGYSLPQALAAGTLNAEAVIQHLGAKVGILPQLPSVHDCAALTVQKIS